MASSRAGTSSAFSRRPSSYDVFINFRGRDTRENFISLLYDALRRDGIHAFIDSEELWEGEDICPSLLRAIRGSKISIPVFSEHYADSKYCLLELAQLWDCHLSDGQTILPIFIDVEPRDVRHQTGSFEGPFQEHQMKRESAIVEDWKNALTEVGNLKGWTLKGDANIKEQSTIVKLVVQRALGELATTPLDERKHLVGVDSRINDLLHLLHIGSNDVRFVGICGMGGLGKTAIAEVVYNRIFKGFNGNSFLTDVREEASQGNKGLVSLQKHLLRDIFKTDYDISSVSRGSKLIAERLHREKILLIIDDVGDHKQLDALAGGLNWFGGGSRVIITTRDKHILNVHNEHILSVLEERFGKDIQIYMPEELNFENSLQLFSLHAFSKKEPPENYKQLSHEVVRYAKGLPLTLEVLGSFLIDKNKEEWEETLERLKDILDDKVIAGKSIKNYDDKVFGKLMISYNKLGDLEKTIFLDVACHFNGWFKEEVISIWEACELRPRLAIKELTQKHLLKIDAYGGLRMHDQLRYMGRRIVLEDSHGDPAKRSRLWSQDEIWKALKMDTGTQMVEGIFLDRKFEFETEDVLSWEDFKKMPNLRFLQFDEIDSLNGDFAHLPSKLRWFRSRCTLKVLPPNFYHPELVYLDISCNDFEQAWNDPPQNKNKRFQKLKFLELRGCHSLLVSPNFFSWFPCLQRLNLNDCRHLLELPDSICLMASLKTLSLKGCYSLKKLPGSIGDLKHLVKLSVCEATIEELPEGIGQLEKLEELDVSGCNKLVKLPTSLGRMRSLLDFDLRYTMIVKLPDDFSKLSSLEVLRTGSPWFMCRDLDPTCYMSLESLSELPSTLTHLQVGDYVSLPKIPDLSHLERLEELLLQFCNSVVELPDLSSLRRLRKLDITYCKNLEEIHGLEGTELLEELDASNSHKLTKLPDLSKLNRLRRLDITNCENLEEIHGLEGAESLEELDASNCYKFAKLPDLSKLKRLRKLDITNCKKLEKIQGLDGTESLEELKAMGCYKLIELPDLSKLTRLRKLEIMNCEYIGKIYGLEGIESCYKITETRRKIHGQGKLLHTVGEGQGNKSIADDEIYHGSPMLCVVFAFTPRILKQVKGSARVNITFKIEASIRWRVKETLCRYLIRVEDIKLTPRDIIYIHHFNVFPSESEGSIEILTVGEAEIKWASWDYSVEVKFWKVLFENKESDQQMLTQQSSAMLVADFFSWLDADDEEVEEEEECASRASNDESDEDDEDNEDPSDDTEEEEEERSNTRIGCLSCLGFRLCF